MKPLAVDLFCGAGGMSEGILQAGFHIIFSSDINKDVELTYVNRHEQLGLHQGINTHYEREDIRNLTGEFIKRTIQELPFIKENYPKNVEIDVIFGGPPCQGFSRAGKRNQNDPRNLLFKEYIRVVNELQPNYVVMENVEGFMDMKLPGFTSLDGSIYPDHAIVPDILINEFSKIGYLTLPPQLLDASDFGVPQRRKRAIFIGYKKTAPIPSYPTPFSYTDTKTTVKDAIGDLIHSNKIKEHVNPNLTQYQIESKIGRTKNINGFSIANNDELHNYHFAKHENYIVERFSLYRQGESTSSLRSRIFKEGIDLTNKPHLLAMLKSKLNDDFTVDKIISIFKCGNVDEEMVNILLSKKNNRLKLDSESFSATIVTLPDDYISPFENRIFTVREMARLQSFDDSFVFCGKRTTGGERRKDEIPQYSQVGNAVPPLLAKAIALEIIKLIPER